jgi:hypothetical protein
MSAALRARSVPVTQGVNQQLKKGIGGYKIDDTRMNMGRKNKSKRDTK